MSRSNPNARLTNPSTRFFEWKGDTGGVRYYDKGQEKNIEIAMPFVFIVLDELSSVRGWDEPNKCGISSNEVREIGKDVLRVRSFKGGDIATGVYAAIKEKVHYRGGAFCCNVYIAYRDEAKALVLGQFQFQGAALNAWIEFRKASKDAIFKKAIAVTLGATETKGKITWTNPKFELKDVAEETNLQAIEIDRALQAYLTAYLANTTSNAPAVTEQAPAVETPVVEQATPVVNQQSAEHIGPPDDLPF